MTSIVTCTQCQTQNRSGSKFCQRCGQSLPDAASPPQAAPPGAQPPAAPSPSPPQPVAAPGVQPQPPAAPPGVQRQPPPPQPAGPLGAQQPPGAARQAASTRRQKPAARFNLAWIAIGGGLGLLLFLVVIAAIWFFLQSQDAPSPPVGAASPSPAAVASQVPEAAPTVTPTPILATETPLPTTEAAETAPTEMATPALTSTPLPATPLPPTSTLADPQALFRDDFETGIKPEWDRAEANAAVVNEQLVAEGILKTYLGNNEWTDYKVSFELGDKTNLANLTLFVRVQDQHNFLKMQCLPSEEGSTADLNCGWFKVIGEEELKIPGADFVMPQVGPVAVEIKGNSYQVVDHGLTFLDDSVSSGGINFVVEGHPVSLEYFEVVNLP